jgi:hypothetical protein
VQLAAAEIDPIDPISAHGRAASRVAASLAG